MNVSYKIPWLTDRGTVEKPQSNEFGQLRVPLLPRFGDSAEAQAEGPC